MSLRTFIARVATGRIAASADARSRRDGFALPLAIMVLALLTMGIVAGFAASSSEMSTSGSQKAQARAYSYAQMGLEQFLTRRKEVLPDTVCRHCWLMNKTIRPSGSAVLAKLDTLPTRKETLFVNFTGGSAVVRAVPVRLDIAAGKGTYFVTSTGTDGMSATTAGRGKTRQATRTVGVFVTWNKNTINVLGALVSFSGIVKNGTGTINGVDQCGSGANVAGITVPFEDTVRVAGGFAPTGTPPYDTLQSFATLRASTQMDWGGIRNGGVMPADYEIGSATFPSAGTFAADTNFWPVIHIRNAPGALYTLPWKGRGMLIVDNDLAISGSNQWDGVILVGGQLTSNGNNVTSGTVMAGLNRLIGSPAGYVDDATLNGQKSYQYNSCSVAKATSSMARYVTMPNTWMDNVAGY